MATAPYRHTGFSCRALLKTVVYGFLTEYETPKIVMIHSYAITTLLRIMQTVLLLYSVFYLLLYEKGYQKHDTSLISSITLKVKGIGYIDLPNNETYVFDGTDYIVPASENNAIFIMTNFISTDQSRAACAESATFPAAKCVRDTDCQNRPFMANANGRWTGRCLFSSEKNLFNQTKNLTGLCEIEGWCPVEDDSRESTNINEILNFTIFIKNFIEFPLFDVKHRNMVDNLKSCVYDPINSSDCPIFRLNYILNQAEKNLKERQLMLRFGGVIRVKIDWDCNLDRNIKLCKPQYSFARLDTPFSEETFSPGFNFRFASHWRHGKKYLRMLKKAFGLRLIISVSGKAGKFDFITLTLNTGSLVGIFGLATFFCDLILLNLSRKAAVYRDFVFQRVQSNNATRRNSVSQNAKEPEEKVTTIFTNPNTDEKKNLHPFWSTESFGKFSNTTSTSNIIDANQLLRLQPSLGLTNVLNWEK